MKGSDKKQQNFVHQFRCFICNKPGHKKSECRYNKNKKQTAKCAEDVCLNVGEFFEISKNWCLDSGATTHLCNKTENFQKITNSNPGILNLANNSTSEILGKGTVKFTAKVNNDVKNVSLENASFAPDLRTNLISVSKITDRGYNVIFKNNQAEIVSGDEKIELCAKRIGDLYYVPEFRKNVWMTTNPTLSTASMELVYKRLGHASIREIQNVIRNGKVTGIQLTEAAVKLECEVCLKEKMTRTPFPKDSNRKTEILQIIHTDLCGSVRSVSLGG